MTDIYITTGNLTWKEESEGAKVNECNIRCQIRTRKGKEREEMEGKGGFECGSADSSFSRR